MKKVRERFIDRGLLLTRKLLSQGFSLAKMKSSLRTFYGHYHDLITVTEYGFATRVTRSTYKIVCTFIVSHNSENIVKVEPNYYAYTIFRHLYVIDRRV
jgi:hypothetical protein